MVRTVGGGFNVVRSLEHRGPCRRRGPSSERHPQNPGILASKSPGLALEQPWSSSTSGAKLGHPSIHLISKLQTGTGARRNGTTSLCSPFWIFLPSPLARNPLPSFSKQHTLHTATRNPQLSRCPPLRRGTLGSTAHCAFWPACF